MRDDIAAGKRNQNRISPPEVMARRFFTEPHERDDASWRFETFGDPQLEEMREEAIRFCAEMMAWARAQALPRSERPREVPVPRWLVLLGPSEIGKSYLVRRIHAFWVKKIEDRPQEMSNREGFAHTRLLSGRRKAWAKLTTVMKAGSWELLQQLCDEQHFLAMEDVLATDVAQGETSAWAVGRASDFAEWRLGKWTVWDSNLLLADLGDLDNRIPSRCNREAGNVVLEMPPQMEAFTARNFKLEGGAA